MHEHIGNILVTSASKKIPLIDALKNARVKMGADFLIYAGDRDINCLAKYFIDAFWHMPNLNDLKITEFITYCQENEIKMIIPTRDGELSYFAENKQIFKANGIAVLISNKNSVEICLDKLKFYWQLKELGYPTIKTSENIDDICSERYVVKDRYGAGSTTIGLNLAKEQAILHSKNLKEPIFQPFIQGKELSVDAYISKEGIVKGVIARRRDLVVNGESQVTTIVKNEKLEELTKKLLIDLDLYGHVVMQVIIDETGRCHIIEINSRFGGASTLSIKAGLDSFYWFILESSGSSIKNYSFAPSKKHLKLIRYPKDEFIYD